MSKFADVAEVIGDHWGLDFEEKDDLSIDVEARGMFSNYISDGPGFCGEICHIAWGASPEHFTYLKKSQEDGIWKIIAEGGD